MRKILPLLLLGIILTACKESPPAPQGSEQAQDPTTSAPAPLTPEAEPAPEKDSALSSVVPVAVVTGGRGHLLLTGLVVRPDHPTLEGDTGVVFLLPPYTKAMAVYVWRTDRDEPGWDHVQFFNGTVPQLIMAKVLGAESIPAAPLTPTGLPINISSLLTSEWGDLIESNPLTEEEQELALA